MSSPPDPQRSQGEEPAADIADKTIEFSTTDKPDANETQAFQPVDDEQLRTIASSPEKQRTIAADGIVLDAQTVIGQSELPSFGDRLGSSDKAELSGDIKKFQMIKELGSGGFGTVIRARDKQLDREVAIKIIKSASLANDPRMIKNFKSEARAAASLRHPNIVPVHQSGDDGKDQMFIVFDYIPGNTLRDVIGKRNLSIRGIIQLMAKIASALGYAHSKGIVHRDVKPANILIAKEDHEPHIADFGCARRRQFENPASSPLKFGHFIGTPPYFSPEQAAGRSHLADARTDVWAMGVILDEMITGRRTFRRSEKSKNELFNSIQNDEPVPLRERCKDVDRDLNAIWKCCLEKEPNHRYASGLELAEDLEAWLRGDPVSVRPLGFWETTARWARRNPGLAGLMLAVLTTITIGFLVSSYFWRGEVVAKRAQVAAQIARLASAEPDGVDEILRAISQEHLRDIAFTSLRGRWTSSVHRQPQATKEHRLALALNLFTRELEQSPELQGQVEARLLEAAQTTSPRELRLMFEQHQLELTPESVRELERVVNDPGAERKRRLRALCSLLAADKLSVADTTTADIVDESDDAPLLSQHVIPPERTEAFAQNCVRWLQSEVVTSGKTDVSEWVSLLLPLREYLTRPLQIKLATEKGPSRRIAGAILFDFYASDPEYLRKQVLTSEDEIVPELLMRLNFSVQQSASSPASEIISRLQQDADAASDPLRHARDQARCWIAAMVISDQTQAATLKMVQSPTDPTPWTVFEQRAVEYGLPVSVLLARIEDDQRDSFALYHLLLALSKYDTPVVDRQQISQELSRIVRQHPDGGVHSACSWLMRQWGFARPSAEALPTEYTTERNWRINDSEVFIRISNPNTFVLGCSPTEIEQYASHDFRNQDDSEFEHFRRLPCAFEISTTETTTAEYNRFLNWRKRELDRQIEALESQSNVNEDTLGKLEDAWSNISTRLNANAAASDFPATEISWYDAVAYCVWRSENEGLESCYGSVENVEQAFQTSETLPVDLTKSGYRLPTLTEWEYACRGGTRTPWNLGLDPQYIPYYATCQRNSEGGAGVVALRMPNRFGLFDTSGNVLEWTSSAPKNYPVDKQVHVDPVRLLADRVLFREVRGGGFTSLATDLRSGARGSTNMSEASSEIGFRLVRTLRVFDENDRQ